MPVELRSDGVHEDVFHVWTGERNVAVVRVSLDASTLRVAGELYDTVETSDASVLIAMLVERARTASAHMVQLHSTSLLLRHEARSAGFKGDIRQPLTIDLDASGSVVPGVSLVQTLRDWGVTAAPASHSGPLRQWSRKLAGGVGATVEVVVDWAEGRSFKMTIPDRPDLMPEAVACCADTAGAVLRRFATYGHAVQYIYFDRSERGLVTGQLGGLANAGTGDIHLNIGLVAAEELVELARMTAARRSPPSGSNYASAPYGSLDATTAHEVWHQVETMVLAKDYRVGFEMRRRLGQCLGVDTLEHAIKGGEKGSPPAWQEARRRLSEEVSDYATTNPVEATAEMFTHWWRRTATVTPVVACFGELVDELIPPPSSP